MSVNTVLLVVIATCSYAVPNVLGHSAEQHKLELENRRFEGDVVEGGVQFKISVPYTVLFKDEIPRVVYGFRNTSEQPYNVGRQFLGFEERESYDPNPQSRLWLQFSDGKNLRVDTNDQVGRDWQAIKDGFDERDLLKPNDSAVMMGEYRQGFDRHYEDGYGRLRALYLVGDKEYIASNWISIEVLREDIADGAEMFELDYGSEVGYKAPIYIKSLNGERWLFIHRNRISKIPKGATPRFEVDKETAVLSVYFDGTDYEPVLHNVRMIRTLSGPRELVPHLYAVDDLKATFLPPDLEGSLTSDAMEGLKGAPQKDPESHLKGEESTTGRVLWALLFGAGLLALFIFLAKRPKNHR